MSKARYYEHTGAPLVRYREELTSVVEGIFDLVHDGARGRRVTRPALVPGVATSIAIARSDNPSHRQTIL